MELESKFANSDQVSESFTMSIRWCLVEYPKQENPDILVPLVLLAESHLDCVGFRVIRDITVYDRVALQAWYMWYLLLRFRLVMGLAEILFMMICFGMRS